MLEIFIKPADDLWAIMQAVRFVNDYSGLKKGTRNWQQMYSVV